MSFLGHPVTPSKDNLDDLLRAFFQAEMPSPWPSLEAPEHQPVLLPAAGRTWGMAPLKRSRLALAASVALLVGGSLFMASNYQGKTGERVNSNGLDSPAIVDPLNRLNQNYRIRENLIQEQGGTEIKIEIFEQVPNQ
jgi:hypothetical protein